MGKAFTVYTDDMGEKFWRHYELIEARRTPDEEEGFTIPITISESHIVREIDEDIIDVQKHRP